MILAATPAGNGPAYGQHQKEPCCPFVKQPASAAKRTGDGPTRFSGAANRAAVPALILCQEEFPAHRGRPEVPTPQAADGFGEQASKHCAGPESVKNTACPGQQN